MKGIDILCASQASTAISLSMDQASSSSSFSNTFQLGGRAIDRHNPIITDSRRTPSRDLTSPASFSPKPCHDLQKAKKKPSSSSKAGEQNKRNETKGHHDQKKKNKKKSAAEKVTENVAIDSYSCKPIDSILRKSWVKAPADLVTPAGSSRYLLSDNTASSSLRVVSDYDPVLALTTMVDDKKAQDETNHASNSKPSSSSKSDQVVALRVSLHCKGCEGKVRKHLSRMQGVTSFNIDFAAKKVTVVGDVTPLSVLASISKVKNAQIWPASASALGSGAPETRKKYVI